MSEDFFLFFEIVNTLQIVVVTVISIRKIFFLERTYYLHAYSTYVRFAGY